MSKLENSKQLDPLLQIYFPNYPVYKQNFNTAWQQREIKFGALLYFWARNSLKILTIL